MSFPKSYWDASAPDLLITFLGVRSVDRVVIASLLVRDLIVSVCMVVSVVRGIVGRHISDGDIMGPRHLGLINGDCWARIIKIIKHHVG